MSPTLIDGGGRGVGGGDSTNNRMFPWPVEVGAGFAPSGCDRCGGGKVRSLDVVTAADARWEQGDGIATAVSAIDAPLFPSRDDEERLRTETV